ncbi:MAG: biotin synthase BioB [Spirochaetales bacterium]|nr:biotin synthase BioB [Spirochaetales bacterium]
MKEDNRWLLGLSLDELEEMALARRSRFFSNKLDLCSIYNAKSGMCSEDCGFCAQSKFFDTGIRSYSAADMADIIEAGIRAESHGINRFSLVSSGRGLDNGFLEFLLPIYRELKEKTSLSLCASHGLLSFEQAKVLKEAGVSRYHHNLETGPNFFHKICTTHSYQERIDTIKSAMAAGLEVCSGGIIGLGESIEDVIELAETVKELGVDSFPINILTPVKGTPMGENKLLEPDYIYRLILILSIILEDISFRVAGGRTLIPYKYQKLIFSKSVDGMMVGNYLTTDGLGVDNDMILISEAELSSTLKN